MDAGCIDVHCGVVVYEFLCGWCVLNSSGSQQTAPITLDSDIPALSFTVHLLACFLGSTDSQSCYYPDQH